MKNKTIFITGGNEGIGLATALLFAEQGANVAIMGRRADKNDQALKSIEGTGARCISIAGDVTRATDVEAAVSRTVESFGALHFAFNNAGIFDSPLPFSMLSEEAFDRMIAINLKGVWLSMKYELTAIAASGGGAIVNTGSMASGVGVPMLPAYTAAKHGVAGLTKSAALEYATQNIRVNAVCPGPVAATGIFDEISKNSPALKSGVMAAVPMGRAGEPREIAGTVLYLCSGAASYVTGQVLYVDGGYTVP